MRPIGSTAEVFETLQKVKAGGSAFCTNFFPVQKRLEGWIQRGELRGEIGERAAAFFRRDRDFWRFYFCAASPADLSHHLDRSEALQRERVVMDLVGNGTSLAELLGICERAGFRRLGQLVRLARAGKPGEQTSPGGAMNVETATPKDTKAVLDLLEREFDPYSDQLPLEPEIEEALAGQQIWVVRNGGHLGALLFFETQGFTSTIRYWVVAGDCRSQGFGSALIREYFNRHSAVKRFVLWVLGSNQVALERYRHYDYLPDGLVDYVLANANIHT